MRQVYTTLLSLFFTASFLWGQIIPTEIMYNPPEGGTDSLEYLELYNAGAQAVNLQGYTFSEGINLTFGNLDIPAESYIVLCGNDSAYLNVFGIAADAQWESGALSNGGEPITLLDSLGNEVFSLTYDDNLPWPEVADGDGPSLELCDLSADFTQAGSWGAAKTATGILIDGIEILGTPGSENDSDCGLNFDVRVEVSSNMFTPQDITIDIGQTVLWENIGGFHNVNGTQATFPNNPASFSSGAPSSDNWTYTYTFSQAGLYNYQCDPHAGVGMTGTVTVVDPNAVDDYPVRTIAEMTTSDANGNVDSLNVACTLEGVIHGLNRRTGGYEFALIDDDGNGITVFSSNEINNYTAEQGDRVQVKGEIGQFNGSGQINADSIELISTENELLSPRVVTTLDESTESEYVTIEYVRFVDPTQWAGDGASFNLDLEIIATGEIVTCRIDGDFALADLNVPPEGGNSEPFYIVGIGGQFDSSEPYDSGYQIFPSTINDFFPAVGSQNFSELAIKLYPNPVSNYLIIEDVPNDFENIQVIDIHGQVIRNLPDLQLKMQINCSDLQAGQYFITAQRKGKRYYQSFIKQ